MQYCPDRPPHWPPPCFLPEVRQELATRAQAAGGPTSGKAGPACVPTGIFQGRGAGPAATARPPALPPLRKCVHPAETLGREAAAGGRVCPHHPH